MKNDEKTEHLPSHEATLVRPSPAAPAPAPAAPAQESEQTVLRAPTEAAPAVDPDATIRTTREQVADTAARTLQAAAPTSQSAYAQTLQSPGPAAYAPTLQSPPLTGPEGTKVMANRLVGSLDDAGEGHHGPMEPGTVIKKRFVLETMLGKGGMGLVFGAIDRRKEEARDPNPRVALKVLNADFQRHPQAFMALQREARKAQTLAHPNVVTVFDFDRDGDAVYMTMELLTGRTLDSMTREARGKGMKREVALPIIRGIAEGLAYAHRKGIVHSDLKPGNVFIVEDGTAKILDFGIARAVPSMNAEASKDVFDAGSLGAYTEAYATDEMIDGVDPHPADDMYALGIIAYELLTGFHPYQRHSAPGARKLGLKPAPLKGLKRKEMRAIEACLSLERKRRPQDAGAFLKLFRGVTALQKATFAAAAVLALVAGYQYYQYYVETSPSIPFSALSAADQKKFTDAIEQGNQEWQFFESEHNVFQAFSAIDYYAGAYTVHPRNREAVAGLKKVADALLALPNVDKETRRKLAEDLKGKSPYYEKYAPVVEAARQ
ncbi:MAG TPA: serine/threonine-protein kinase [Steroidobacteraceae bacterium]|jgi:Serine/threonine protein kinase|nr:serine/threonine-protein kinase [Steroidobacteraceae bacterium]